MGIVNTKSSFISEIMSKGICGRIILSLTFAAALYPLTLTWFSRGDAVGWTGQIIIDTLFSFFDRSDL